MAIDVPVALRPSTPLSPAQELLWAAQRLYPDAPLSNMAVVSRLDGVIDPDRFVAAFETVVLSNDSLRTLVDDDGGLPRPRVIATAPAATEVIDLALDDLDDWMADRIARPVPIATAGYDSVLIRHAADDWSWWMNLHHLVTDAWSSSVVFQATARAYAGEIIAPTSYADYVAGLAEAATTARSAKAEAFWAKADHDATPTELYVPTPQPTTVNSRLAVPLDPEHQDQIDELLAGEFQSLSPDLSRFALMGSALAVYLHRLSGADRISVGVPVHHRNDHNRDLIGLLIELFPLTIDIEPADTFRSVFQKALKGMVTVLRRAEPGTSPQQNFDVVLNVITARFGPFGDIAATSRWIHPGHVDPHHRLRMQVYDFTGDGRLNVDLDLNHGAADADHRRRAPGHFRAVLDALLADPDAAIGSFGLLDAEEHEAIVEAYNDTGPGADPIESPAVAIHAALGAEPDRAAILDGEEVHAAAEIEDRIARMVSWLRAENIAPGTGIGIRMDRSVDAVVAIHAALRHGAPFTPIDPCYPEARQQHLIDDGGLALVLDSLPDLGAVDPAEFNPADAPPLTADAYVLYTSGSTGLPKGVPITHAGLAEYLAFARDSYVQPDRPFTMALLSSLSFDLTITTLFLPLLAGGSMTIHREDGLPGLVELADERRADIAKATPSHLELLTRLVEPEHPLQTFIVGGEAFGRPLADRLLEAFGPDTAIYNEYGPTEGVVGCMIHRYDPEFDTGTDVPIGRPAPGTTLFVLDRYGHPVPAGAIGELYLHRPGMTAGYRNRPDLNAEKFVTHPHLFAEPLYRTGDRVRMIPGRDAGTFIAVYLGRVDEQLKVQGVRLEPGEVEAAIASYPDVDQCTVGVWSPRDGRAEERYHCPRCGMPDNVPGVTFGGDGHCSVCHQYDEVRDQAGTYFKTHDDLLAKLDRARTRRTGDYDCLHLLSGGKDSSFALYQLVGLGFDVLTITLDNGFISEGALDNVRRICEDLDVDHLTVTSEHMNEIFRDSLERFSNVCNGCYKTIYTSAVNIAHEHGIPMIVTGLSRGQFFETRLTPQQFAGNRFDPDAIDAAVLEARKAYHRTDDAVNRLLDVSVFDDDAIFEQIEFVDYYRYTDVELEDMLSFLDERAPWIRPDDTGRSTNCLVNAAGIHVHQLERGFHNYAMPYAWDVQLGHKTREETLEELDDPLDLADVESMLAEIGYEPRPVEVLTAWYVADADIEPDELRRHVAGQLPAHAVPAAFVRLDEVPLTPNGKIDRDALPAPSRVHRQSANQLPPTTELETLLADAWGDVLGLESVGVDDDFFAIGGTSLHALEMIVRVGERLGLDIPEATAFRHRDIRGLAAEIERLDARSGAGADPMGASSGGTEPIAPFGSGPRPLSAGEEAMRFTYRLDPSDTRYNVTRLYSVDGPFDADRFTHALRSVVQRHATLHTSYATDRRELSIDDALHVVELQPITAEEMDEFADSQRRVAFDLENGPLVRVHVGELADDRHRVLVGMHHIVSDAGSLDVFWDQVATVYAGTPLAPLDVTYADHASWQADRLGDTDRHFWRSRLPDIEPQRLMVDRPSPGEPDGYVHRELGIARRDLQAGPGFTPFTTALTALSAALDRFADSSDQEIAITASVRDHSDAAPLVGYFLNTLPIRIAFDADQSFDDAARTISDAVAEALPHRTYPFARMVRDARADGRREPTASVMLAFEDLAPAALGDAEVDHRILAAGTAVNTATVFVQLRGEAVAAGIEYDGSTISRRDAEALLDAFAATLEAGLDDGSTSMGDLAPLGPDVAGEPVAGDLTPITALIAAQIRANPNAGAVTCGTDRLTYAALHQRSRAIGRELETAGVRAGDRVALLTPRSTDMVAAILGVLDIGAAYVPVDPTYPADRIDHLLSVAQPAAIVGTTTTLVAAAELGRPMVDLAAVADDSTGLRSTERPIDADDPAYVIFTSGSTGTPRGVEISHGNLAASTQSRIEYYADPVGRYLLPSSYGFDSSVAGLFWTLATGGELVIPTDAQVHDVDALVALADDRAVTHTLLVPSLWEAMLTRGRPGGTNRLASFDTVIVAGEACSSRLVEHHFEHLPAATLVNEYGPTEATVWATAHRCEADGRAVPIGHPIPGVDVRIGDDRQMPRPMGVAGELLISGPTVAAGYIGDAEATAAKFVTCPAGRRWYRTGDLTRLRADGSIAFLGRIDGQLSIGGVRIEPEEIEAAITAIPDVTAAAVVAELTPGTDPLGDLDRLDPVVARRLLAEAGDAAMPGAHLTAAIADATGARRLLIAYVEGPVEAHAVTEELKRQLPAHLVPHHVEVRSELERTPHGKIDRAALQRVAVLTDGEPAPEPEPTRGPSAAMVAIWRRCLGNDAVTADSDFFELGGDSLQAVALAVAIEEELGLPVAINSLVESRTPAALTAALGITEVASSSGPNPSPSLLVHMRPRGDRAPLLLLPPGGGQLFGYDPLVQLLPDHLGVAGLRLPGSNGREDPLRSIAEMSDRFIVDVQRDFVAGPFRLFGWSTGGLLAYDLAQRLTAAGHRVELVAMVDTVFPGLQDQVSGTGGRNLAARAAAGDVASVARGVGKALGRRAARAPYAVRRRVAQRQGRHLPASVAQAWMFDLAHRAAMTYRPLPYDGRVVMFSASDTDPELTSNPWRTLCADLEVVGLEGTHFGLDGVMRPERIGQLARELTERL